ncbi:MAG: glycosyltransferase [Paludibacter sp.]|uniref:Glycosyltransferase involved in cell wall bisynthesis n=1 Tax=Flavobacterium frigoris TaxID=229204 RepID=A0A1H9QZ21_FLAFI|nr:glycosyltransferase [Flavobacterium frigoris]NDP22917.1 glycosyltransferase [Paludibacter sp.]SER65706.1 Glycosyltransferase involved in cell wall bisynthesis [Flavobacterium frigoris]
MAENLNSPVISIIMPCYNASQFIKESIESVLSQTYENWELIIVDDGSTDDTATIIKIYVAADNRVRYFYQENGKQGKARNLGLTKSSGSFVAFLDADDLWLPEKLFVQILEIEKHDVDLVFSDSYIFNDSEVENLSQIMGIPDAVFYDKKSIQMFLEYNRIPILTVLVKKEKIISSGGFSEQVQNIEDYHLWLKMLISNCTFYSSNFISSKYRVHQNSETAGINSSSNRILITLFNLSVEFPVYKKQIEHELKLKFKRIYKTNLFTKLELVVWIKKNTAYLSKSKLTYFYLFLNYLLPTKVTKRFLMHILND